MTSRAAQNWLEGCMWPPGPRAQVGKLWGIAFLQKFQYSYFWFIHKIYFLLMIWVTKLILHYLKLNIVKYVL